MTLPVAGAPIGVFDSGMGGLTVLAALRSRMPGEDFLYLGDTARLPYGTKSGDTVARYALQAAEALVARGIKALVVACNTASHSTRIVRLPFRLMPGAQVRSAACQVFVALAEEGWTEGPVADAAAESYLRPLLAWSAGEAASADVLVLGCTHFPRLIGPISRVAGPGVRIVDSAATTAAAALAQLEQAARLCGRSGGGSTRFLATDGTQRFVRVGSGFLGAAIAPADVELIDL